MQQEDDIPHGTINRGELFLILSEYLFNLLLFGNIPYHRQDQTFSPEQKNTRIYFNRERSSVFSGEGCFKYSVPVFQSLFFQDIGTNLFKIVFRYNIHKGHAQEFLVSISKPP